MKGCLTRATLLVGVLLIAYVGWRWGSAVFPKAEEILGIERGDALLLEPTPEMAEEALVRLEAFAKSDEAEFSLEAHELSALLRYSVPGVLPRGVIDPQVRLNGDHVELRARVIPEEIPSLPDLGRIVGILPDTVSVVVGGALIPFGDRGSALVVERMLAQGVPIPRRLLADVLEALGREAAPGLPAEAILVPVPSSVRYAYVEDTRLILLRD